MIDLILRIPQAVRASVYGIRKKVGVTTTDTVVQPVPYPAPTGLVAPIRSMGEPAREHYVLAADRLTREATRRGIDYVGGRFEMAPDDFTAARLAGVWRLPQRVAFYGVPVRPAYVEEPGYLYLRLPERWEAVTRGWTPPQHILDEDEALRQHLGPFPFASPPGLRHGA